jgi:hypothetical protein
MHRRGRRGLATGLALAVVLGTGGASWDAEAQVFVYPRRPNKSQVRWYNFEWKHVDILVGPEADTRRADDFERLGTEPPAAGPPQGGPQTVPQTPPPHPTTPVPVQEPPPGGGAGFPTPQLQGQLDVDAGTVQPPQAEGWPGEGGTAADFGADGGTPTTENGIAASGVPPHIDPFRVETMPRDLPPFVERQLPPLREPRELLGASTGGVRLYYYEREAQVAERAAALIVDSYVYLVGQFDYVPTETFPYVLYSSYQEFLQTNLFPLQEGTLGVTSPTDLKLTLPYFGDHQLFQRVSAHEMAHQFTIQKVRTATKTAELWGDPLQAMPLWFIEGLAEYYAMEGVDPEAEMLVRDIVVHPDFELGYVLLDFYEDRPWSFLWTYKMGQVRCAFLEETYGRGTLQKVLAQSPRMVGGTKEQLPVAGFPALLEDITGDNPRQLARKFEAWLKRWAFRSYLSAEQASAAVEPLEGFTERFVDSMESTADGNLLLYRSMDTTTFQSRLMLVDRRAPDRPVRVAVDGVPGVESLHPVFGRNFDVHAERLVFVAEARGSDVLYVQEIRHQATRVGLEELVEKEVAMPGRPVVNERKPWQKREAWRVRLSLGSRREIRLGKKGIIAAYSPAFSPDGQRIAFIAFDPDGTRDIYVAELDEAEPDGFRLLRMTTDVYTERQLAWGPSGIVFNSDATEHGYFNLFRVDPAAPGQVERLTTEGRDHLDPGVLSDGRIMFTAFNRGRADLHLYRDGVVERQTDVATGLFDVSEGPDGSLWALYHQSGRRHPVLLRKEALQTRESLTQPAALPARTIAQRALTGAEPYRALAPRNWELGPPFALFGAGQGGIYGQLVGSATDRLRNHGLLLNVAVLGRFEYTDGYLLYVNQERRITWGTGLFQSLVFRFDQTFPDIPLISGERFYGALGSVRYPFNQFVYVQTDLGAGGVSYFLPPFDRQILDIPEQNPRGESLLGTWLDQHRGPRFQTEATLRLGYDTIRYAGYAGPVAGSSLLLEGTGTLQPFNDELFGTLRVDGERYFPIWGRTHVFVRAGAGRSLGGQLARQFYLSSFDTLRGVPYGNQPWLLGRNFFFSTAELQVPLNALVRVLILTDIEAIAGVDFGGVGQDVNDLWAHRVLSPVVGLNFGLGPLLLRLHFAKPIDIGSPEGLPSPGGEWVTNFSIRILGFEGLFDRRYMSEGRVQRPRHETFMGTRTGGL